MSRKSIAIFLFLFAPAFAAAQITQELESIAERLSALRGDASAGGKAPLGETKELTFYLLEEVIPHLAVGGVWSTSLTFVNLSIEAEAVFPIRFFTPQGTPWVVAPQGVSSGSTFNVRIPAFGSVTIELPSRTLDIKTGWALIEQPSNGAVGGHAIFRDNGGLGRPIPFEAVVPLSTWAEGAAIELGGLEMRIFYLPFDNTNGFNTCMAFVNSSTFSLGGFGLLALTEAGGVINFPLEDQIFLLDASEQTSFCLRERFPHLDRRRGTLLVIRPTDVLRLSAFAFRFDPQGSFTTFFPMSSLL